MGKKRKTQIIIDSLFYIVVFALGGPEWCARAQGRLTPARRAIGVVRHRGLGRARRETDPAIAGERPY